MLRRLYKIAKSVLTNHKNENSTAARSFRFEALEEKALLTKLIDLDPFSGILTVQVDSANDTALVYDQGPRVFIDLEDYG